LNVSFGGCLPGAGEPGLDNLASIRHFAFNLLRGYHSDSTESGTCQ